MPDRRKKMVQASRTLARYFGLNTVSDLSARIALDKISDPAGTDAEGALITPDATEAKLIELMIDTSDGGLLTNELIDRINDEITNAPAAAGSSLEERFGKLLQVHFAPGRNFAVPTAIPNGTAVSEVTINEILGYGDGQGTNSPINANPANPTKQQPNLAIHLSNSVRVTPAQRDINPTTLYLNSIPNVELQRALPYVEINFFFPKPPMNSLGNRIQTLSLPRFLYGARKVEEGSTLDTMMRANTAEGATISSQNEPASETYSLAGMEMFTTPQTMVNADEFDVENATRANPVLDRFRPPLTLNELSINLVSTHGLMSYKTGRISLTLHDRSRLSEVAEFVKPDLYAGNEITIEYGWSHPDGESDSDENPYGNLINGLRTKEKYQVKNSSYTFDDSGQVEITLEVAMRGVTDMNIELISSDNETFGNPVREIKELSETISEISSRVFNSGNQRETEEIRGIQILDVAQDALNHTSFNREIKRNLRRFRREMRDSSNPDVQELLEALDKIYGDQIEGHRRSGYEAGEQSNGDPALITQVKRNIQESISNKIRKLQQGADPFLTEEEGGRLVEDPSAKERRKLQTLFNSGVESGLTVSLAQLLLHFVGEPLANTEKFDEVQMVYYPFNEYSGFAAGKNIANFLVDVDYFADELARYKLSKISRSSTMTVREFMTFIADTLIDDPAARSYGLEDQQGALYRRVPQEGGVTESTEPVSNAPDHQERLENLLRGVTPDGSFKPPQVSIYLETLPRKTGQDDGEDIETTDGKTILKLHVFDKLTSAYSTLGELLRSSRKDELNAVGEIPSLAGLKGSNPGVVEARQRNAATLIQSASDLNLIEKVPTNPSPPRYTGDDGPDRRYRIVGGQQRLKEFLMRTTPYVIYGAAGTALENANLSSIQDSRLGTVHLLRSFRKESVITPNGENPGGLPLRIIPSQLSLTSRGCPLVNFAQELFVDFQTGTSADNFYRVSAVEHTFTPGRFQTNLQFAPADAWGQYESLVARVGNAVEELEDIASEQEAGNTTNSGTEPEQ